MIEPVRNSDEFLLHRKPSRFACANTKRKCYVCDSNKIIKVFTNFKNKNKHYYCKDCADKYIIHKPDKKFLKENSKHVLASCLGEKQFLKLFWREIEKTQLVAELRSKNPYANNDIIQSLERFQGYDFCCDMLEKMLKEERK